MLLALVLPAAAYTQFYQGSNQEFGKNRVQYREFDWLYYPGTHFEVYYYIGGDKLAEYVLMSAEKQLPEMEKFFDYTLEDKIQVLAYLKQSEFRQSNIGITSDDQTNLGGTARIMGSKIFVYYEDSHAALDRQIRNSLARVVFSQMLYGGDWKDVLKSNTLLSMPRWYEEGVIRFSAEGPSERAETFMRDQVMTGKFKTLNRYYGDQAALGGQAFWSFVQNTYGESVIANILYMARISRNIETGFSFVLGVSLDAVMDDFVRHYTSKYGLSREDQIPGVAPKPTNTADKEAMKAWQREVKRMGMLKKKYKSKYQYYQFKLSPDGDNLAYVTNEKGQYKVWIYNISSGKRTRVLKADAKIERLIDQTYPVLAWHPTGQVLSFTMEKKGRAYIGTYNLEDKEKSVRELFRIEKVVDMEYSKDGKKMIFSGVNRGQTDLYLYQFIGNNQQQLTNDIYDDLNARFIEGDQTIIFASNRPDDTLRIENKAGLFATNTDIFLFHLNNADQPLEQITATPGLSETHPAGYAPKHYTFLSQGSGVANRFLATVDSAIAAIDTTIHYRYFTRFTLLSNYQRSPLDYQFDARTGTYTVLNEFRGVPVVFKGTKSDDMVFAGAEAAQSTGAVSEVKDEKVIWMEPSADTLRVGEVDTDAYLFEDEKKDYKYEKETVKITSTETGTKSGTEGGAAKDSTTKAFQLPKSRNYKLNFSTDFVVSQFTNNFGNLFYLPYTQPTSINPGLSALNKVGMSDLMEDYKVVGGFRISGNLLTNTYALSYENLKHRIDRKIVVQRQGELVNSQFAPARVHIHSLTYQWKYPFNEFSSVRLSFIARNDRTVVLALDPSTLQEANTFTNLVGLKGEYVYDNTISRGINLYEGTRLKFWYERYQRPDNWNNPNQFNVVGGDVRHYVKLYRSIIGAFRMAGATSFGAQRLVHYLGGVDNWMFFQRVDNSTQIATDQNYRFQAFAGPMRGFWVNARNGNSFALVNSEVRVPVFKTFMQKPIKSDFIENFQVVGFFDAGAAWTGRSPYDDNNRFNTTTDGNRFVAVTVFNNREPIIYGYGFGLRSKVLGYFLRADWSWGVDDNTRMPRVFYLSLNLDF